MSIASEEPVRAGRTTTPLDDRVIQFLAPLRPAVVGGVAFAAYAAWGVLLPFAVGANTVELLVMNTTGAAFAALVLFGRLFPFMEARLRHQRLELTSDLRRLSSGEFEQLVGEMFRREGWNVTEIGQDGKPDGNIDLRLRRDNEERLVQCKQWQARSVGVDEVRKLAGTLMRERLPATAGMLVTSSVFTSAAEREATEIGLDLINGRALLKRLEQLNAAALLERADNAGTAWACPDCSTPMVLDRSPYGWWLHCPHYGTTCRGKHDLGPDSRHAVEALLAGP